MTNAKAGLTTREQIFADLGSREGTHRAALTTFFSEHLGEQIPITTLGEVAWRGAVQKRSYGASVDYSVKMLEQRIVRNRLGAVYKIVRDGIGKKQTIGFYKL